MASMLPPEIEASARHLVEMLRGEAIKYVAVGGLPDIRLEAAVFVVVTDPANGLPGYEGVWRNALNERVGRILFNSDGSYYAEYDLCVRHPGKPRWFIEAIAAWGRDGVVKAEARLLPFV